MQPYDESPRGGSAHRPLGQQEGSTRIFSEPGGEERGVRQSLNDTVLDISWVREEEIVRREISPSGI